MLGLFDSMNPPKRLRPASPRPGGFSCIRILMLRSDNGRFAKSDTQSNREGGCSEDAS